MYICTCVFTNKQMCLREVREHYQFDNRRLSVFFVLTLLQRSAHLSREKQKKIAGELFVDATTRYKLLMLILDIVSRVQGVHKFATYLTNGISGSGRAQRNAGTTVRSTQPIRVTKLAARVTKIRPWIVSTDPALPAS